MATISNVREFRADLAAFAKHYKVQLRTVVGKVSFDIHRQLVERTPRDTGRAKSNWIPSIDQPAVGTVDPDNGSSTKVMMAQLVQRLPDFPSVWISNNLPYIVKLNQGHSRQAPPGFVEVVVDSNLAKVRLIR